MTHEIVPHTSGPPVEDGWLDDAGDVDPEILPGEPVPWPTYPMLADLINEWTRGPR